MLEINIESKNKSNDFCITSHVDCFLGLSGLFSGLSGLFDGLQCNTDGFDFDFEYECLCLKWLYQCSI
jgi:hypothetical protein